MRFGRDDRGQSLAEYAIALAVVGAAAVAAALSLSLAVGSVRDTVDSGIQTAAHGNHGHHHGGGNSGTGHGNGG
jgi:hypothetical protein